MLLVTIAGCALWDGGGGFVSSALGRLAIDDQSSRIERANKLPAAPVPPNGIHLDVTFVERPAGDPLLGSALWSEIGQVGAVGSENKESLSRYGFRVGHASSKPPRALERLLGMKSEFSDELDAVNRKSLMTRRMILPEGSDREVQTSEFYPDCTLELPLPAGVSTRNYENARCVLRVTPRKLQENWIRVDFLPEIHYGENKWRAVMIDNAWQGRTSQEVERLYPLQFSVDLNLGEMAVITGDRADPASVGQHFFFVQSGKDWGAQRILVVRFSELARGTSVYSQQE